GDRDGYEIIRVIYRHVAILADPALISHIWFRFIVNITFKPCMALNGICASIRILIIRFRLERRGISLYNALLLH
ncbi:MAG: hypothetical protein AB2608_11230, partial [Candidatus Thiodiazotropha sp.]